MVKLFTRPNPKTNNSNLINLLKSKPLQQISMRITTQPELPGNA